MSDADRAPGGVEESQDKPREKAISHVKHCACGDAARHGQSDCRACHALAQSLYRLRKKDRARAASVARINERVARLNAGAREHG
jgi:hypothetical protein